MFKNFIDLLRFINLDDEDRRVMFYSENNNYWPHINDLLFSTADIINHKICYVSSDKNDEGLKIKDNRILTFYIGDGSIRNWFFENLNVKIAIMTMPSLNQFQIKKSKYKVHYVYFQHSLVSLHMAYVKNAFNHYDTIFCSGSHHIEEMKKIQVINNLKIRLFKHGYCRLDYLIKNKKKYNFNYNPNSLNILIAPTWGEDTLFNTISIKILEVLKNTPHKIILRPHHQSIKKNYNKFKSLIMKFNNLIVDTDMNSDYYLNYADLMISDWSGVALEFAVAYKKPIIYIDTNKKINNPDYPEIDMEPIEVKIRDKIGFIMSKDEINNLPNIINEIKNKKFKNIEDLVYNLGFSSRAGAIEIRNILKHAEI